MTIPAFSGWLQAAAKDADALRLSLHSLRADIDTTVAKAAEGEAALDDLANAGGIPELGSDERALRRHNREPRVSRDLQPFLDAADDEGAEHPLSLRSGYEKIEEFIRHQESMSERMNAFQRADAIRETHAYRDYFRRTFGESIDVLARELVEHRRRQDTADARGPTSGTLSRPESECARNSRTQVSARILTFGGTMR